MIWLQIVEDRVDIDERDGIHSLRGGWRFCFDRGATTKSAECAQDQPKLGSCFARFNLYEPLPAHPDAFGKFSLMEPESTALVTNDQADIARGSKWNGHKASINVSEG